MHAPSLPHDADPVLLRASSGVLLRYGALTVSVRKNNSKRLQATLKRSVAAIDRRFGARRTTLSVSSCPQGDNARNIRYALPRRYGASSRSSSPRGTIGRVSHGIGARL